MSLPAAAPSSLVIEKVSGRALPLRGNDIDTDRIIPARFLRCVTFEGLEKHVFEDDRLQAAGNLKHAFDDARFRGASILVVSRNFGCGSSREHAPQALQRWGIRAAVGESFGEIFFGNCVSLGLLCMTLPAAQIAELQTALEADPTASVDVDVRAREVRIGPQNATRRVYKAAIPDGARESFLGGTWDATSLLLRAPEEIRKVAHGLPYVRSFAE